MRKWLNKRIVGLDDRKGNIYREFKETNQKICIVVEEADESEYWLEIIIDTNLSNDKNELLRLYNEANEITKIMTKAKSTSYVSKT